MVQSILKTCVLLFGIVIITLVLNGTYYPQDSLRPLLHDTYEHSKRMIEPRLWGTPISTPTSTSGGITYVLILTYMRSGSSLTGDIVQHSPGAFYVYEPLRKLDHVDSNSTTLLYTNGTSRPPPFDFKKEAVDIFRNWFTCNLTNLYEGAIYDGFLSKGLKTSEYYKCLRSSKDSDRDTQGCLDMLQRLCDESPIRAIKTIRMELSTVLELFESLPNLKIIHLVRDPRATLSSQKRYGKCSDARGSTDGCVSRYCTRLENDVLEEERLKEKYPDRIMTAFYEKIASHPLEATRELYDFIGSEFTPEAEQYVFNITMAGHENNCGICTVRSNSTEHIDSWKQTITSTFLDRIQERCNYILKRYRYETFIKNA